MSGVIVEAASPPEGQTSFSGIPEAQFVEDVEAHMTGEDNAEDKLKVCLERSNIREDQWLWKWHFVEKR